MKQWVNACIREFLIPLLNYIIECVLMTTEIAEHISSMHSLPKVLFVDVRSHFVLSPLLQKPGCHVPQSILHRARIIALAKEESIAYWRKELPNASETDLEMMYTHLSNGLMHVVVEGYDKYSKEETIRFVSRVVKASLSLLRQPAKPFS